MADDEKDETPANGPDPNDVVGEDPLKSTGERLDKVLGDRPHGYVMHPECFDMDEAALNRLEAHLKGTGEYSPEGSVWQKPVQGYEDHESWPTPGVQLPPPPYRGPARGSDVRRGVHRRRRPRWKFWGG